LVGRIIGNGREGKLNGPSPSVRTHTAIGSNARNFPNSARAEGSVGYRPGVRIGIRYARLRDLDCRDPSDAAANRIQLSGTAATLSG